MNRSKVGKKYFNPNFFKENIPLIPYELRKKHNKITWLFVQIPGESLKICLSVKKISHAIICFPFIYRGNRTFANVSMQPPAMSITWEGGNVNDNRVPDMILDQGVQYSADNQTQESKKGFALQNENFFLTLIRLFFRNS